MTAMADVDGGERRICTICGQGFENMDLAVDHQSEVHETIRAEAWHDDREIAISSHATIQIGGGGRA